MAQFLTKSFLPICKRHNYLFFRLRKNNHINIQLKYSSINSKQDLENETNFGFQTVKVSEKTEKVKKVFEDVAIKYDMMNDIMSFGIHRLWKDQFMLELNPSPGTQLLDVAGGTGDIAFRFLKYLHLDKKDEKKDGSHVTVADINAAMLEVGKKRAQDRGLQDAPLSWLEANAESLPLESNKFDAYTIAFGIRNVTRIEKALAEAYRVLKPGGRFLCLEFSHVPNPSLQRIYNTYSFNLIPLFGELVAGQWKHYQYLVESIRKFPTQEEFATMIQSVGFQEVTYRNMSYGVVAIHSGFKL